MKPDRAAVAGGLAAALILLWVWLPRSAPQDARPDPTASPAPAAPSSIAPARAAASLPVSRAAAGSATSASVQAIARAAAPGSAGPPGQGVWELCGVGRLPVPPTVPASAAQAEALAELPDHLGRDAVAQARLSLLNALDGGPPRWRAAAVMLRGADAAGRGQEHALPELATEGDDGVIAMWVLQRCGRETGCAEADLQRWARIEPDNLAPWLHLLQRHPLRRDEYMARMAAASRFEWHETALSKAVLAAMPAAVPPYLQMGLWIEAIGVEAALALPALNHVFNACREPIERGSASDRDCSAIARVLTDRSDSAMGALLGLRLAERTYLGKAEAAARIAALRALIALPAGIFDEQQPLSCAGVARTRAWVEQRAQLGELGAMRARAAEAAAKR